MKKISLLILTACLFCLSQFSYASLTTTKASLTQGLAAVTTADSSTVSLTKKSTGKYIIKAELSDPAQSTVIFSEGLGKVTGNLAAANQLRLASTVQFLSVFRGDHEVGVTANKVDAILSIHGVEGKSGVNVPISLTSIKLDKKTNMLHVTGLSDDLNAANLVTGKHANASLTLLSNNAVYLGSTAAQGAKVQYKQKGYTGSLVISHGLYNDFDFTVAFLKK